MGQIGIGESASEKLHPFFVKSTENDLAPAPSANRNSRQTVDSGDEHHRKKRRKTDSSLAQDGLEVKKTRMKRRNGGVSNAASDGGIMSHLTRPKANTSNTEPTTPVEPANGDLTLPLGDVLAKQLVQPPGSARPAEASNADTVRLQTTPTKTKKVLKLNPKTGTLGSPPKLKQKRSPSMVVCIRYGRDEQSKKAIGDKVTQILDGKLQIPSTPAKRRGQRTSSDPHDPPLKQDNESKTTHPFFTGKRKPPPSEQSKPTSATKSLASKYSVFTSTPISPKRTKDPFVPRKMPQLGIKSSGSKVPGAMYPMWPAAGMSHVRGEDVYVSHLEKTLCSKELGKKSKGHVTTITPQESILTQLVDRMDLGAVRDSLPKDDDSFTPAPAELRLPRRRFESGRRLQTRLRSHLGTASLAALTRVDDSSQDELSAGLLPQTHPAIMRHYHSLATQLSAYDKSSCESLTWTQKYAPTTAAQVLQTGKETTFLKQWLEAWMVQSVETGGEASGDRNQAKSEVTSRKKKRKSKLEGFVVDSDDEVSGLDELSETEDDEDPAGMSLLKKSVVRSGDVTVRSSKDPGRLKNTVIISGPHGCGKTAAVYAVAKELDFEVFEINSSSRRSGKDILEKVGDMTRNHLVQQHRAQAPSAECEDDQVTEDLVSGKQGMMTAFFKPKPTSSTGGKSQAKRKPKEKTDRAPRVPAAPKAQKQSLILLEEADVLYGDDKQFWPTLMGMMAHSKRPFVVTCNDENLVPIQSLNLHGILRFSSPPPSLAVDLCLVIAANEGHALGRTAVESLYSSRGRDLRATISELNYWCQIGIGDRRGGFDWFYSRWPKGCDMDENGDVVRVISEGTYLRGMGWMGRDMITTSAEPLAVEEEVMRQAWDSWQLDMGDWYASLDMEEPSEAASLSSCPPSARVRALADYEDFCGAMSKADVCSRGAFGTTLQEHMDPTLPKPPSCVRDDFIIGRVLLEADAATASTCPSTAMSIALRSLAREKLHSAASLKTGMKAIDEGRATSALDSSFRTDGHQLTRLDIARAFDPIAVSPKAQPSTYLDPSVFDRPTKLIILDVAPWIRSIVAFEDKLMQERLKLSNLLSAGGKRKRMRTTRSAYSALEGGERKSTRCERYFGNCLSTAVVMRTGAESFHDAAAEKPKKDGDVEDGIASSPLAVESP